MPSSGQFAIPTVLPKFDNSGELGKFHTPRRYVIQHFVPILPKADGSNARLSQIAKSNVGIGRLATLTLAGMSLLPTVSDASEHVPESRRLDKG